MLEARAGNRFEQGWQFYAVTSACSWCSLSPASRSNISSSAADGDGRRGLILAFNFRVERVSFKVHDG